MTAPATAGPTPTDPRAREIADALAAVHARIADAARDAGREAEPALVVVTKTHPACLLYTSDAADDAPRV